MGAVKKKQNKTCIWQDFSCKEGSAPFMGVDLPAGHFDFLEYFNTGNTAVCLMGSKMLQCIVF